MNLNKQNNYSSFWLDNGWDNNSSIFDEEEKKKGVDLIALASYRRAISNFVSIVTGESDIKVTFNSTGDSYTDGKAVTISSKLDDKLFDSTVGLALHEGSHIKLSDFDFLKNLENNIPQEYFIRSKKKGYSKNDVMSYVKNLLNYVEDRRIDFHIFSNAPGYKGYYHSMYNKYFYSKVIDKALGTDEYTEENMDSYMFRIINLTNKNTDLSKLNGLRDVWKVLDIKNVSRLTNTESAFNTALDIYNVILNNIPDGIEKTDDNGNTSYDRQDGSGNSEESTEGSGSSPKSGGQEESREITDTEFESLLESIEKGESEESQSGGSAVDTSGMDLPESKKKESNSKPTSLNTASPRSIRVKVESITIYPSLGH